jgi:hypothetical protein
VKQVSRRMRLKRHVSDAIADRSLLIRAAAVVPSISPSTSKTVDGWIRTRARPDRFGWEKGGSMVSGICVSARCLQNVIHYITTGHLSRILQDNKDVKNICMATCVLQYYYTTFPGSRSSSTGNNALTGSCCYFSRFPCEQRGRKRP